MTVDALSCRKIAFVVMMSLFVLFQINRSFEVTSLSTMDDMMDIPPNIKEDIKPSLGPISDQAANTTIDASPKSLDTNHTMSVPFNMSKSSAKTTFDPSPKKRSSPASGTFVNSSSTSYIMPQPFSPEVVRRLLNPPPTNRTMNACVLIMDDTIRCVEWLAYHYTVLPLGHLVVAIDPNSKRIDKIDKILNAWREYITIDAYYNDSFLTLGPDEGWGRQVWGPNHRPRGWFKNQNGITHRSQAHKRRQNFFSGFCFRDLYEKNKRGWTILTDTDEFVTFNYRYPETEDPTRYDSETKYTSRADVDRDRARVLPFRDLFANMTDRVTIAQYLETYDAVVSAKTKGRRNYCMRIPGLTFSSRDSDPMRMARDFASGVDASNLMTLRQRQHAAKDGSFSKAMLHLRTAGGSDWFKEGSVVNVHTPNRRMCGRTKKEDQTGSGADYISSLFRIHHYKAGTVEAYLERAGDWRGGGLWRFYFDRNVETVGENSDLTHWFKWFVDKVGKEAADRLLLQPLNETYNEIGNIRHITEAKEKISKLVPGLLGNAGSYIQQEPAYYTRTNLTIGACMYILDGTCKLSVFCF